MPLSTTYTSRIQLKMSKLYFTCSFDDGDIADIRLAELLMKYNIKGTFYIPQRCSLVNQSLSDTQIQHISKTFEIGGHTMSHQILTRTSAKKASKEISSCKKWLQDVTGKDITSFCPPTGRYNNSHIEIQKECGFKMQRTVEMLSYSFNAAENIDGFISLPATIQVYNHNYRAYLKNLVKRFKFSYYPELKKNYALKWEQMSRNYLQSLFQTSNTGENDLYFHLWGHSWEIDNNLQWDNLDSFLNFISSLENIQFCTNSELSDIILVR